MDAATLSEVVEARTLDIASNMTQPAFGGLVSAIFGLKPTWRPQISNAIFGMIGGACFAIEASCNGSTPAQPLSSKFASEGAHRDRGSDPIASGCDE